MVAILSVLLPLHTALDIGRAICTGDLATLEMRVDWPRVRESLKSSLADMEREKRVAAEGQTRPSLWTRLKMAASARYADPMIERHLTPNGVIQLARGRGSVRGLLQSQETETPIASVAAADAAWLTRALEL
jgi:hypothetical protein